MLRVTLNQAKPGMVLATPVHHPERPDTVLLNQGFVLDQPALDRLGALNHPSLWIEYPELDFIAPYINHEIANARGNVTRLLKESFAHLNEEVAAELDYSPYRATVDALIHSLLDNPRAALSIQDLCETDDRLARHSSAVCFLSVLMGLKLGGYLIKERHRLPAHRAKDVVNLGVAAMLHDIGMRFMTPDGRKRWYETYNTDDHEWRSHTKLGFRALRGKVAPSATAAILHHHQNYDGSGFPAVHIHRDHETRPLRGDEIHIFARIISVADLYERFRYPPGASKPAPRVAALHKLQQEPYWNWIDPVVFNGLLQVVPPYAPGTIVTLSDGKRAAVARWLPEAPCRPRVLLLEEHDMSRTRVWARKDQFFIDLRDRPDLHIAEVDGCDVSAFNFDPPPSYSTHEPGWHKVPEPTDDQMSPAETQELDAA
ncbi:MAG: HD domain-containing protein [Phycisphaeraceae bacterium]|nr:HD domain-containing protein [Phycisphaerales bacterium]MCA9305186.1 HD domain-containing protein [Phycisphaerales bacterium]MCB9843979.1 HD domain-containing protein [Phycisphaeraceae bacterium]